MPESLNVDLDLLTSYYQEMVRCNLLELEVEIPEGKIVLKRYQPSSANPLNLKRRRTDFLPEFNSIPAQPPQQTLFKTISSPINGVFYRSSSPQSTSFVKEGDLVAIGATVCIVEAMKVMNEIKSDSNCKITKILAENGKPVTKDQPLFQIEPA